MDDVGVYVGKNVWLHFKTFFSSKRPSSSFQDLGCTKHFQISLGKKNNKEILNVF